MENYIRSRIRTIKFLPTFPGIVGEVMSIIEDPKSSATDIAKHMDPSMVSEVLRVANSAYFGTKSFRHITTVERAVAVTGYEGLSYIVLQMPFLSMIKGEDQLFDRKGFYRHSISSGILAKTISSAFHMGSANEVYIAGMLHDIGVIIIYEYFKEEWHKIGWLMEQKRLSRLQAEKEVFTEDHAYIGAVLLEAWDIPETIVESVRVHHSPDKADGNENAYVTSMSNRMAKQIDFEADFVDFETFFRKQRDFLQSEMPEKYFLKRQVEVFEQAYYHLAEIEKFVSEERDGKSTGS